MKKLEIKEIEVIIGGTLSKSACFMSPGGFIVSSFNGGHWNNVFSSLITACWNDHD